MSRGRAVLLFALLAGLAGPGRGEPPAELAALTGGIQGLQRLPVTGLQMVHSSAGLFFVSANGRYVFTGPAWDLWHGRALTDLAEAAQLAGRVDLARLALDPAALGALAWGTGGREVVVFVDPRCPHCRTLLAGLPPLLADYRFRLVPLPVLGPASEADAVRLACWAQTDPEAARAALLAGPETPLPAPGTPGCGQAPVHKALLAAHLLGIGGVPFLIAPDGRLQAGPPADLAAWLEAGP